MHRRGLGVSRHPLCFYFSVLEFVPHSPPATPDAGRAHAGPQSAAATHTMLTQNRSLAQLTRRLSAASAVQAAAARPRSIAMPNGRELRLLQHFFDEAPVEQPRRHPRRADLTGMKVWPTAVKMLEQLQRPGSLLETLVGAAERPLRILELGAGTGVLGLGLAMLCERSHVVLTDPNLDVNWSETESGSSLEWLQANVDLNRKSFDALGVRVDARALEWSSDEHINALLDEHRGEDTFDLIVGELLYDSDNYSPLLDVLARVDAASSRASSSGGRQRWRWRLSRSSATRGGTVARSAFSSRPWGCLRRSRRATLRGMSTRHLGP